MKRTIYAILLMLAASVLISLCILCLPIEIESPILWAVVICAISLTAAILSIWAINKSLNWITVLSLMLSYLISVWMMINYREGVLGDGILFCAIPLALGINFVVAKNKKSLLILHLNTFLAVCVALKYSMLLYYNNVSHDAETPGVGALEIIVFSIYSLLLSNGSFIIMRVKHTLFNRIIEKLNNPFLNRLLQ